MSTRQSCPIHKREGSSLATFAWVVMTCISVLQSGCKQSGNSSNAVPTAYEKDRPWLVEVGAELGIDFSYVTGETGELHMPEIMAAGVGLLDYDNDGDLDICFTNGNQYLPRTTRDGTTGNRLFRQEENGAFTDVTVEVGLGDVGYGMGIAVGDVDNDGDLDVYFTNYGPDRLYLNDGDGTFTDATDLVGLDVGDWSTSATFLDYDRDGDLDLFVCRYVLYNPDMQCFDGAGRPTYCTPKAYPAINDILLRNDGESGQVRFTDVTVDAGLVIAPAAGLGVTSEDFDDDGWLDIYVANDGYVNHFWINQRDGTFLEYAAMMGVAYNLNGQAEAGMGVIARDFDNDLDLDLFLTHLADETNTLYANDGSGFLDETSSRGLAISSRPTTGFGIAALDIELDGDLDLAIANGRVSRRAPRPDSSVGEPWDTMAEPNLFYLNDGRQIFQASDQWLRPWIAPVEVSRGLAAGDLDRDGDLDLVMCNIESPAKVYRNDAPRRGAWLHVRAIDPRLNRDGYHARIRVEADGRTWTQTINPGGSYLSSAEARAHFGLGDVARIDRLEVQWLDGLRETFEIECVDCAVVLRRGEGSALP